MCMDMCILICMHRCIHMFTGMCINFCSTCRGFTKTGPFFMITWTLKARLSICLKPEWPRIVSKNTQSSGNRRSQP